MLFAFIAVAVAAAEPPQSPIVAEARHAIAAGRMDQARAMVARAIKAGAPAAQVDELLADLAFVSGSNAEALVRYESMLATAPRNSRFAERAGVAALRTGDVAKATALLEKAVALPDASWQAWNARGAAADLRGDWATADLSYGRAAELNPNSAEIANNRGWSLLLRGEWEAARAALERAAKRDPNSSRIANNLELARAALAENLPRRRAGESAADWAARLNDAGVAAHARGDRRRAIAAFAQAIEARVDWFERAANNLAYVEARP